MPRLKESQSEPIGHGPLQSQSRQAFASRQPINTARKYVPMAIQRKVFRRDQCCQYRDKNSGKQCKSNWQLTIDHIHPIWANGTNELENLRLLCAAHNRAIYRQQANLS